MRSLKHESLWIGFIYFIILLGLALWVRDIPNQHDPFITIQQIVEESRYGDPKYFAAAAIDIAENGWVGSANEWVLNLWPPGFVLLEALIIKVLGPDAPVIVVLQIITAVLFSIVLVLLYDLLNEHFKGLAFALPLLIFAFPVSRAFLLQPIGITFGEGLAVGFFMLGILLAFRSAARRSLIYAAYAGLCLALSAYFRSQFELILLALTAWAILLVIAMQITRLRNSIGPELVKSIVKTMVVVLLVAHTTMVPWRAYHWINQETAQWVLTTELTYPILLVTSEYLGKDHHAIVGGGNVVCRIDPATCDNTASPQNAKKAIVKTFIAHPVEWFLFKFELIGKYWFSSSEKWGNPSESSIMDLVTNALFLVSLIALAILLLAQKVRSHYLWILLLWFNISLFSAFMAIYTLVHFEVRYFFVPKIVSIMMFIIVVSLYFRPIKRIDAFGNNQFHE